MENMHLGKAGNTCKYCNTELFPVLDLGVQPFSNTLISMKDYYNEEKYFVLNFSKCPKCNLFQTSTNINPEEIFDENYPYFSSVSQSWLDHCEKYTNKIIYDYNLTRKSKVIELASNDGYLLNFFKKSNIDVLGIEPCKSVAEKAIKKGIKTDINFFDKIYAKKNFY